MSQITWVRYAAIVGMAQAGSHGIHLDARDPLEHQPPHYYEDSDGHMVAAGEQSYMPIDESDGFRVHRTFGAPDTQVVRTPTALGLFIRTAEEVPSLALRITVDSLLDSTRKLSVSWNGHPVGDRFDTARFFERETDFFIEVPGPVEAGVHALRIAGEDSNPVTIRRVFVAGDGQWVPRPPLPPGGEVAVLSACYMPDPRPPADSQAVEGRNGANVTIEGMRRLYWEHADFGAVRVAVKNRGTSAIRLREVWLNGKPIEEHYVNFLKSAWDARGVVWYRVRPRRLEPGQCGQVYIRFRRRPAGEQVALTLKTEGAEDTDVAIPFETPGVAIEYVTVDESMQRLYVYARREEDRYPGRVAALRFNGGPLPEAAIYGPDFPGNIALAVADLPEPVMVGEYHVAGIETEAGVRVDAQFRVMPWQVMRSSIFVPPERCDEMNMNTTMWMQRSLEVCEKYDIYTTTHQELFDLHDRVSYIFALDKVDAKDGRDAGPGANSRDALGYHARRMVTAGYFDLMERYNPGTPVWAIMNATVRPLNWAIYGQYVDITSYDPYIQRYFQGDHAYVRESLDHVRRTARPRRMIACLGAYGYGKHNYADGVRGPVPAEWRQNVTQAVGCGAKGVTSWVDQSGSGDRTDGWHRDEAITREMARVNRLLEGIEDELLLSVPIDLATCDAGLVNTGVYGNEQWPKPRVWVRSLLCGPDAILVAAVNHIPAQGPEPPKINPARDVTISVWLPEYLRQVEAFEATEDGRAPFPHERLGEGASLHLDELESGRIFLLRRISP